MDVVWDTGGDSLMLGHEWVTNRFWVRSQVGYRAWLAHDFFRSSKNMVWDIYSLREQSPGSRVMDGFSWWWLELLWCVLVWFYLWKSHSVFEVKKRWVVENQVRGDVAVGHVAFIMLAEVWGQGVEARPASRFFFGRRMGLLFVCVVWLGNRWAVRCFG